MPLAVLVEALAINKTKADSLHHLMRLLVHSGFFIEMPEGYVLTPASHLLLKDNPFSISPHIETILDPTITQPWNQFSNWFKTDGHASLFESFHGSPLWQIASKDQEFNHSFNEAMASDSRLVSSLVVSEYKDVFEGVDSLVDIAGGTGTMAKGIAKAFPNMSCIVLDLPHVIEGLKGSNNLSFVGGDNLS
ncbi:hypothetical protein Leryth_012292 [Lithospermum erythrorhizon]|nr:hypothetical protein Leryth_012292 [Lithospermum erythrorhizon]